MCYKLEYPWTARAELRWRLSLFAWERAAAETGHGKQALNFSFLQRQMLPSKLIHLMGARRLLHTCHWMKTRSRGHLHPQRVSGLATQSSGWAPCDSGTDAGGTLMGERPWVAVEQRQSGGAGGGA